MGEKCNISTLFNQIQGALSNVSFTFTMYAIQCTMAQALKKIGIKDLAKIMTLAPIFSSQNYFR